MNEILRTAGIDIPFVQRLTSETPRLEYKNALILAPPSVVSSPWLKKFDPYSIGYCSGWMQVRGNKRRQGIDRGFVVSDHADWNQLNETIRATGAERIYVTHGYTDTYVRWLHEEGFDARELKTQFVGETLLQSDDANTDADILTTEP
jgi:putative mRNA 3-end processing factor